MMNLWPPFLGTGVKIEELSDDWRYVRVRLRFNRLQSNLVNTQFGGSMFMMADPFWMIMAHRHMRRDHLVWDTKGEIDFLRPGTSTLRAEFTFTAEVEHELREQASSGQKVLRWFTTDITDAEGEVVARVRKELYVRRKPPKAPEATP